jgi:hypothetical protein
MIRTRQIRRSDAWGPTPDQVNSFANGIYRPCKILGLGKGARLVRLVRRAGRAPEGQEFEGGSPKGEFWFDEQEYFRIKSEAEDDLKSQAREGDRQEQIRARLGMYLRFEFRNCLAVRRDWTPSFDFYVVLAIPTNEDVIALEGFVGVQPVYSNYFKGAATAKKGEVKLEGGLKQYLIDFKFPPNAKAIKWIDKTERDL